MSQQWYFQHVPWHVRLADVYLVFIQYKHSQCLVLCHSGQHKHTRSLFALRCVRFCVCVCRFCFNSLWIACHFNFLFTFLSFLHPLPPSQNSVHVFRLQLNFFCLIRVVGSCHTLLRIQSTKTSTFSLRMEFKKRAFAVYSQHTNQCTSAPCRHSHKIFQVICFFTLCVYCI